MKKFVTLALSFLFIFTLVGCTKKEEAKKDRQKVTVFGLTTLGLMEMTRERRGLPLSKQNL